MKIQSINRTKITKIDISTNVNLKDISLRETPITSVDISNNPLLKSFFCQDSGVTKLDMSNNPKLVWFGLNAGSCVYISSDYNMDDIAYCNIPSASAFTTTPCE